MGLIRTLHAWAGAILALILVVLGLSGSLLVLRDPWVKLTVPEARAEVQAMPAVLGAAAEAVEAQQPQVRSMMFGGPHLGVHRIYVGEEGQGYAAGDGRLLAQWIGTGRVETWVFELHHSLLSGETGDLVTGTAGVAGALIVLTGVIVWFPAWRSFGARVWPRTVRRRSELISAHRNLGVIIALPLFVFCLTGGAIIFNETSKAWMQALGPGGVEPPKPPKAGVGDVDWPRALAAAQAAFPDAALRLAAWPAKPGAPVVIRMKQPAEWHPNGRTLVYIDPADARVLATLDAQALGPGTRAYNAFYPVHAGMVGGLLYEAVTFLSGLGLAILGGFGLWSFLIKQTAASRRRRAIPAT
jgi:uncharacterized iron-regulated membrane protein